MQNCNKKERAKGILFTHGNQKVAKSFCKTYKSNGTCESALRTNITMVETCVETENKQIVCCLFICICLFMFIESMKREDYSKAFTIFYKPPYTA